MNSKLKVLVIDDDEVIGRSFERVLSGKGFDVSTAMTGEQALEDLSAESFDVVFTDIKMPGMDGLEVAERIKDQCPWTPVVVVTGYGTAKNEARASVLGVNGFVRKPLTPEVIESITLKALLDANPVEKPGAVENPDARSPQAANAEPVTVHSVTRLRKAGMIAKNIGLFFAAPFIALAYIIALPIVGFYIFGKLSYQAYAKKRRSV